MKTNELIEHLRFCADMESLCTACNRYDDMGIDGGTNACMCDLMQKAAGTIEALQAELRDEMHRHDRLQDFEVAEAAQLAEAKETTVMLRDKLETARTIICALCAKCDYETHEDSLIMCYKCGNISSYPDCGMFESRHAVELIRVKAERDALLAEMKREKGCGGCVHRDTQWNEEPCDSCRKDPKSPAWEWRGRS